MLKRKIYLIIEDEGNHLKWNKVFDYVIITLILLNVIALITETIPEISGHLGKTLHYFEFFSVVVFTIEYCLRIYVSGLTYPSSGKLKSAFRFIFTFYGMIDLLAILPFYIPFLITMDFRFLRFMRLLRFIRILKISRYNNSLTLIADVIKEKKTELAMTGFVALMVLFIASFFMFYVEGDVQPDKFPNILACFWWAIATLTTVGYGDVYPITAMGRFLSGIIAVMGIGLVALPTGLVSAGFMDKINRKKCEKTKCPHCGGEIDFD